jgi:homocysteine S-methyltransferase
MSIKASEWHRKIIAYPNSGDIYDAQNKSWSNSEPPQCFSHYTQEWIDLGVDILGGCCGIGPTEIKKIKPPF